MPSQTLTDAQERFVYEYLIDQNASAAAERAGYSPKTKGTQAAKLMKNPLVRERIVMELGELYARLKVTAQELLTRQVQALQFDPARLFRGDLDPVPLHELDEETRSAVTVNYEQRSSGQVVLKVKQTPRHVALAVLWRRYDQFQKMQGQVFGVPVRVGTVEGGREVRAEDEGVRVQGAWVAPVLDIERVEAGTAGAAGVVAPAPEQPSLDHQVVERDVEEARVMPAAVVVDACVAPARDEGAAGYEDVSAQGEAGAAAVVEDGRVTPQAVPVEALVASHDGVAGWDGFFTHAVEEEVGAVDAVKGAQVVDVVDAVDVVDVVGEAELVDVVDVAEVVDAVDAVDVAKADEEAEAKERFPVDSIRLVSEAPHGVPGGEAPAGPAGREAGASLWARARRVARGFVKAEGVGEGAVLGAAVATRDEPVTVAEAGTRRELRCEDVPREEIRRGDMSRDETPLEQISGVLRKNGRVVAGRDMGVRI